MSRDSSRPLGPGNDIVDFDALESDPRFAEALADAQTRSALRQTLVTQRKAAGLTQKQVAEAMETTQSAVSDLERGGVDPHLSTLQRYARAVGATLAIRVTLPGQQASASTWLDDEILVQLDAILASSGGLEATDDLGTLLAAAGKRVARRQRERASRTDAAGGRIT